jgi:ElaB/YqjD/DUF883 family membrane-anchored ribosome-binding protein
MHDIKPVKEASQDFAADFAVLRDDIAKLTRCVSEIVRDKASTATSTVMDAVDDTRQRLSDRAAPLRQTGQG